MEHLIETSPVIIMEAAILEQIHRSGTVSLHPILANAPLIYDANSRRELTRLYTAYIACAASKKLPFLMCSPTWRANRERVQTATDINADAVRFMQATRQKHAGCSSIIKIGGLIGCKNDCYRPEEGLAAHEAETFHSWQIERLARAGVDFLIAETLPAFPEALGIARAMARTNIPYIISFVVNRSGCMLDGTGLVRATSAIDSSTDRPPLCYMINCAYPTFLCADTQPPELFSRLAGYLANASDLDHCDLDRAPELHETDISQWGDAMLALHRSCGITILGGCCGTGARHLQYLVKNIL